MVAEMGWISLHRKIKEHWLWQEKPFDKRSAWIDLLLSANHENRKFLLGNELVEVKKGQVITSEVKLAERWGWSRYKVQTFIKLLANDGMIVRKADTKKTVLQIVNFSEYQESNMNTLSKESEKANSKKAGVKCDDISVCRDCSTTNYTATQQQPNSDPTTTQQRSSTNNNYNNYNNDNKDIGKRKRFAPPTLEQVKQYCLERKNNVDPQRFIDFYSCKGWYVGKNKMKDWKAAVRTWERRNANGPTTGTKNTERENVAGSYNISGITRV